MNRDAEIFAEAIELAGDERAQFLENACAGDAELRKRVDLLIAGYNAAGLFMENSPAGRPLEPEDDLVGGRIGNYSLARKLGEGGCGVVYLAEQHEPVRRQVALKVIKLGMDTRNVIARFEAERQALAMMDHPDIARVFDAGATENGRPYFVMEFVDGVPITKFCDEHSLSMEARLELFARVCVALQHAHQKGIIHRDLKPSNILVSMRDGVPAPKVIDFGIAKATQGRLTEETLVTGFDQFIGTPAYMSPEQAELRDFDIDTRSDVYSLGVLLYELLTGRPPYDPKSLVRAGVEEIRRIIREVDPPRPSTRVSTLGDADLATVARLRRAAPMHLTSVLRGDLDWIVMRCLEKDRVRRYGTASELADDVRRHLRQEPVNARPPDTLYRAQKFIARNRLACASVAAVALALIVGTIVSTQQAIRARRAERLARSQREQAEALLTFMIGDFRAELKKVGKLDLLNAVGDKALAYFLSLEQGELTDTALARQAKAMTQIGEIRIDQARYTEAAAALTSSYERAAALVARNPRDADLLFERAQAEFWIGFLARRRGDFTGARDWFVRYRDSATALLAIEGTTLRARRENISGHHNLAVLDYDRGNLTEAQKGFVAEKAAITDMLAANPESNDLRYRLADIASWLGRVAEAEGSYLEALARSEEMGKRIEELIEREPTNPAWKFRLSDSQSFSAFSLMLLGRRAEAAALLAREQADMDALVEHDPKNQQWRSVALSVRLHRISLMWGDGDFAPAASLLAETRIGVEKLVAAEPAARVSKGRLAATWLLEARLRQANGHADVLAAAERSIALSEQLNRENRADPIVLWEFGQACLLAGRIEAAAGRSQAARSRWEQIITVLAPRLEAWPRHWRFLDPVAQAYVLTGQADKAEPLIARLRSFGYHPLDPLAASTLGVAR